jgi:hypothetical protein
LVVLDIIAYDNIIIVDVCLFSGCKITASFSYVTERGGREDRKEYGELDGKESL